jgi:hypothetical protein
MLKLPNQKKNEAAEHEHAHVAARTDAIGAHTMADEGDEHVEEPRIAHNQSTEKDGKAAKRHGIIRRLSRIIRTMAKPLMGKSRPSVGMLMERLKQPIWSMQVVSLTLQSKGLESKKERKKGSKPSVKDQFRREVRDAAIGILLEE